MKINNEDIARMARELRDEENQQLHVRPWSRHTTPWQASRLRSLIAIPAAAVAGFLLGIWTSGPEPQDLPLMAQVDTVYIKVKEAASSIDTAQSVLAPASSYTPKQARAARPATPKGRTVPMERSMGRPMADDHIRYDLLVKN